MCTLKGKRSLGKLNHQPLALFDRQWIVKHDSTFGNVSGVRFRMVKRSTSACP